MTAPDIDILISRAVDQTATAADWERIEFVAGHDPSVWRDLARAQRLNAELAAEMAPHLAAADRVALPIADTRATWRITPAQAHRHSAVLTARVSRAVSWAGWAVAAALGLAVAIGPQTGLTGGRTAPGAGDRRIAAADPSDGIAPTQTAGVGAIVQTASDALDAYLTKGKAQGTVIGELPEKVIVNTVPTDQGGGYEVVYLRQIMERTRVSDLYRVSSDELGNPTPVPVPKAEMTPLRKLPAGGALPIGKSAL